MKLVYLDNGSVREIGTARCNTEAPDNVECGWRLTDGQWIDPQADYKAQIASYEAALNNGFTDPILGVKLKTTKHAQEMFTALVTMLQEGINLQLITNDTEMVIWNYADEPVELTVLQIRQMLFRYGMYCKGFFDEFAP
jgi:hypothetical protein